MPQENSKEKSKLPIAEKEIIEEVKKLEPEQKKELLSTMTARQYKGPIPPPDILKKFEEICPGSGDRIIKMAENQSNHRQEIEKKVISSKTGDSRLGLLFAFLLSLICFLGGIFLIYKGKGTEGLTIMAGVVVSLIGVFIYGSKSEKEERIDKDLMLKSSEESKEIKKDDE